MALKNRLIIGALLVSFALCGDVDGQVDIPSTQFRHKAVEQPDSTRPFATPGVFDYDAQVFAPLEFTNGKEKDPNCGFFFSLDRTYTSVSRAGHIGNASSNAIKTGSDYIWGTRYDLGWFSEEDTGWGLTYQRSEGMYFTAGQDVLAFSPMIVSMNVSTFELNRMFRQTLSQGGYFEPYIGLRYLYISDKTLEDTTQLVDGALVGGVLTAVLTDNRFKQEVNNSSVGFQAGGRYNRRRGRWRTTCDGAVATTYNQQRYFATDIAFTPATLTQAVSETYQSDQAFVPVIDGQVEFAYNISRDISLRTGFQAIWTWDGIARANTLTTNLNPNSQFGDQNNNIPTGLFDDSHVAAGFLFGVEWRR